MPKYMPFGVGWARYKLPKHIIQNVRIFFKRENIEACPDLVKQFDDFLDQWNSRELTLASKTTLLGMLETLEIVV